MEEKKVVSKASASKVKWLLGEIPGWVSDGLISEETALNISNRYRAAMAVGGRAKLVYIVGILAALLLGTGVILFFASNWEQIPRFWKLTIICAAIAASYYASYNLKYRMGYEIIGEALMLLGAILFGAGIYLVAQAFNLKAHFPNGALLWLLGLVPLFLLIKSKPILALMTLLFCVWMILEANVDMDQGAYGLKALLIKSVVGAVLLGGLIILIYKYGAVANSVLVIPSVVILLTMFIISLAEARHDVNEGHFFLIYYALGIFFGALGLYHNLNEKLPPFGEIYRFFALPFLALGIYAMTFADLVRENVHARDYVEKLPIIFVLILLGATAVVWSKAQKIGSKAKESFDLDELKIYPALMVYVGILFFMFISPHDEDMFRAKMIAIFSNLVLLGFIIALIYVGSRSGQPRLINLGILIFAVDFITRYFDWFWKLLPRSLFFIGGGLVLLGGGIWLEKRRKEWVKQAKGAAQ